MQKKKESKAAKILKSFFKEISGMVIFSNTVEAQVNEDVKKFNVNEKTSSSNSNAKCRFKPKRTNKKPYYRKL